VTHSALPSHGFQPAASVFFPETGHRNVRSRSTIAHPLASRQICFMSLINSTDSKFFFLARVFDQDDTIQLDLRYHDILKRSTPTSAVTRAIKQEFFSAIEYQWNAMTKSHGSFAIPYQHLRILFHVTGD
jgi:hypothetical protein